MDRGVWWATVHGVARVGKDLVTQPPGNKTGIIPYIKMFLEIYGKNVRPLSGVYGSILSLT